MYLALTYFVHSLICIIFLNHKVCSLYKSFRNDDLLYAGIWDELANPKDVKHLYDSLTGSPHVELKSYPYRHSTFL